MSSEHWNFDEEKIISESKELAKQLSDSNAITFKQAQVYALREIYGVPRKKTSDMLNKSLSTVDNLFFRAKKKIKSSNELLKVLNSWDKDEKARKRRWENAKGETPKKFGKARKVPNRRKHHDYFDSEDWTVVDLSGVDNVFISDLKDSRREIRIDMDGFIEPSSEVGKENDNINVSAWIPIEKAKELQDQLNEILD